MTRDSIPTPTVGVFLVAVGSIALLSDFGLDLYGSLWRYWPLILIAIGMTKVMEPRHPGERAEGIWAGIAGLWLLVSTLGIFGLGFGKTWPLILIIAGAHIAWQAVQGPAGIAIKEARNEK